MPRLPVAARAARTLNTIQSSTSWRCVRAPRRPERVASCSWTRPVGPTGGSSRLAVRTRCLCRRLCTRSPSEHRAAVPATAEGCASSSSATGHPLRTVPRATCNRHSLSPHTVTLTILPHPLPWPGRRDSTRGVRARRRARPCSVRERRTGARQATRWQGQRWQGQQGWHEGCWQGRQRRPRTWWHWSWTRYWLLRLNQIRSGSGNYAKHCDLFSGTA